MSSVFVPSLAGLTPEWQLTVVRDTPGDTPDAGLGELSEPALVAAALEAVPGAFDLIVERHRRSVYQLCYRFVHNHEDASDLSQEVFLRAYRGLKNFKGQSTLATWLYRIGVNACLNRVSVKRPQSEPIDETRFVDERTEAPNDRVLRGERAEAVRRAVAKLPAKQRTAVIMRVFQEMSHQDIAESLGTTVGAVKANVFHALQNLKKLLPEFTK
jgi:RNA polymerase sigma-70 factor (ECF subfamily)